MVDAVQPSRQQSDLADVLEMLLDKGIVINADIAVSIGDTQLLGIQVRAAIASFETAAKYGLEFPEGTNMRRVAEAVGDPELAEMERPAPPIAPVHGVNVTGKERPAATVEQPETGTDDGNSSGDGSDDASAETDTASDADSSSSTGADEEASDNESDGDESGEDQ